MKITRDRGRARSMLRPLAAALALGAAPTLLPAATTFRPGDLHGQGTTTREDGTPLATALHAWHLDARNHAVAPASPATVRTVTNCNDDGAGSLRDAVASSASGDTIDLSQLTCSAITLDTGVIPVRLDDATIVGPSTHELAIDGHAYDRVFLHYGAGSFVLRNLTIRNGHDRGTRFGLGIGGCLASAGYLTLDHSTVTGCYAGGEGAYGGAIYAYSLLMNASTLSNNDAYGAHIENSTAAFGGAAFVYQIDMVDSTVTGNVARREANTRTHYDIGGGILTVRGGLVIGSTIDSNFAYEVGGGLASFGNLHIRNSTISGNTVLTFGGGGVFVRYRARLDIYSSTITGNTAPRGGGIFVTTNSGSLQSTIVAGDIVADGSEIAGTRELAFDGANNMIGAVTAPIGIPLDTLETDDPGLQPLAYNGGPTRTHALRRDSRAIDAGNNASDLPSDQRGFARVVGPAADIGAFEFDAREGDGTARIPVPTLSQWSRAFLCACLAILGIVAARRRRPNDD
ncbi:MAG TPA: IPTL-CTERM sorting domain-containing protein [Rhodanobacteraceae bacterium]|nr:IPTL-CTERM sorting domain-containing protein [Rhodanobacteraceae bacterium]